MALHTKRQFADLVGIPSKDLSNYIKRQKVILQGGKSCNCGKSCSCLIDDQEEINQVFIQKRGVIVAQMVETVTPEPPERPQQQKKTAARAAVPGSANVNDFKEIIRDRHLKQNEKIDKENALLDAKLAKLSEEIVPKDVVILIVMAQSEALKGAYLRAVDTFITKFAAENQMTRDQIVFWKKELTAVINEAVEQAVKDSKSNLRKMAREYAGKKGKGERDDS